jgi:hypothetical protein
LLASLLALGLASDRPRAQTLSGQKPKLAVAITFRCLWWSDVQKNGLNPNAPPPKTTEVVLRKWEYSDPIDVPHPDVVDVVVELRNESEVEAKNLMVDISTRWQTGPQRSRAKAVWGKTASVQRLSPFNLEAHAAHTLRVPVNLAERMKKLEKTGSWPWRLQATVTITSPTGKVLARTQANLPVTPGD